jgi:hypothetical protein
VQLDGSFPVRQATPLKQVVAIACTGLSVGTRGPQGAWNSAAAYKSTG